jgi:hypothetical protein
MITMVFYIYLWGGLEVLLATGALGAFGIVAGSQGAAVALKLAQKSSIEFLNWRLAVNLDGETVSIRRAEPLMRLKKALDSSLPLLQLIQQKEGKITTSDSKKLLLAEAGIRDQRPSGCSSNSGSFERPCKRCRGAVVRRRRNRLAGERGQGAPFQRTLKCLEWYKSGESRNSQRGR